MAEAAATSAPRLVAMTGATGFLGRRIAAALLQRGMIVRALVRPGREDAAPAGAEIVRGDLGDAAALRRLVEGADAVVHVAGAIKALNRPAFMAANEAGTQSLCRAVLDVAPNAHVTAVSSLAAREPALSDYSASKRAGEDAAVRLIKHDRLTIIRPPAIYGPGDRETLVLFKAARLPVVPVVGDGRERIAMVFVDDAAAAIAALTLAHAAGAYYVADDRPAGYAAREIMAEAARALGRTARFVNYPPALLKVAAWASGSVGRIAGRPTILNSGKARELLHEDWSIDPATLPSFLSQPPISLRDGFATTVAWYRQAGWL